MPKYLFTSDLRISLLPDRIKWVAEFIHSGHNVSEITDKSDNNNATTLKFYYNLHSGTETCEKAVEEPIFAIRNFVLKFQFPNVRTHESLQNTISERLLLAPYRSVISLLVALAEITNSETSAMSMSEILYYVFCNPAVYNNPAVSYKEIAEQILYSRNKNEDYEDIVGNLLEWNQYRRQSRELINVLTYTSKCFSLSKGILRYSTTHEDYLTDKDYINELITYNKFWVPSNPQDFNLSTLEYISYMNTVNTPYSVVEFSPNITEPNFSESLQQIFYGAPGTGKSHKIKGDESVKAADEKKLVFRTTFHPDSDYSTFVGTYKPTMAKKAVRNVAGDIVQKDKVDVYEDCITYSFVPQAFLQAYVAAWNNPDDKVFLVIEEINRGNCAQIFGDLFQLLDRDRNGWSEYPIMADKDLVKYLKGKDEAGCHVLNNEDGIKDGKLCLPNNLYIWATMNTSDQSLFPIDSAFKRRWDWKYVPIKNHADKNFKIKFDYEVDNKDEEGNVTFSTETYEQDWWEFIKAVNARIESATHSEDKQLGYFFCDPNNGKIDGSMFVGKVIFYLWNDVFKNTGSKSIFNINSKKEKEKGKEKVSFTDFYLTDEAAIKRQETINPDGLNLELVKDFIEEIIKYKEQ